MKAISLIQPWASLVIVGAKAIETRSWGTRYRGGLAIHASKGKPRDAREWSEDPEFVEAFQRHQLPSYDDLPRGVILGTVYLSDCIRAEAVPMEDRKFGNYESGRFAWIVGDPIALLKPVAFRGTLGLWDVPDSKTRNPRV